MSTAELLEPEVRMVENATAQEISRVEIDVQIATAKRYPRSITNFKQQALEMATLDEETAASMFYTLPRAGKKIQGPSIRMAEVVGTCYGNLRYGARIVSIDAKFITAQGACHDLEKNIAITYEVQRRITNKSGTRYNDDMIQTTGNAAMSIALREAIFRVVPRSLFNSIYEQAKLASIGKAKTMSEQRHAAFDWFKKAGATEPQLLAFLERKGIDDVTIDDIITLRGLVTSIKDGEVTIEEALKPAAQTEPAAKSLDDLADKLKKPVETAMKSTEQTEPKKDTEPAKPTIKPGSDDDYAKFLSELQATDEISKATAVYDRWFSPDSIVEFTPKQQTDAVTATDTQRNLIRASRGAGNNKK